MRLVKNKITVEIDLSGMTMGELIDQLEELFPDGRWADLKVEDKVNSKFLVGANGLEMAHDHTQKICNSDPNSVLNISNNDVTTTSLDYTDLSTYNSPIGRLKRKL